ncbi:hypothetical protein RND81_09G104400 [Saponaria officinalis]|uniref:arogenate dehydratase n=1 Tax=Saponaria officinalis TaxID=3572 RepID=A0AAW1IKX3_SAPOF
MHALSAPPTTANPLMTRQLASTNHRVTSPSRLIVRCNAAFTRSGAVGTSRSDWLSTCAVISSQQHNLPSFSVNGRPSLDLVPISTTASPNTSADNDGNNAVKTAASTVFTKSNLPKPLSSDLSPPPMHGSTLRVAYQGVPGAYSEAAAGKAYPGCEAIPCDQFEVAFQAVELWIADRAVLPVENSLGGSIHRNYDLLLRHRLHIVGEVQLPVHHCLLGLPGVRKEFLTRVISHPQALAQCEHTLTELGLNVTREAVDDTAGAAEYVAVNGLRDTAAIASARAAKLYGLQVFHSFFLLIRFFRPNFHLGLNSLFVLLLLFIY